MSGWRAAIARKWTRKFLAAYAATRDPLDIKRREEEFPGVPACQLCIPGADELDYHLKNNPVAGALICTVIGLLVAIPAMFSYNFMVTSIRAITRELDGFAARCANQIEHRCVVNRPLAEEIKEANEAPATGIVEALQGEATPVRRADKLRAGS